MHPPDGSLAPLAGAEALFRIVPSSSSLTLRTSYMISKNMGGER